MADSRHSVKRLMWNATFRPDTARQTQKIGKIASWSAILILAAGTGFGGTSSCPTGANPSDGSLGCAPVDDVFNNTLDGGPISTVINSAQISTLIYGSGDHGELYSIAPTTGAVTAIGEMGHTMNDIAMYNGVLYGVDATSTLYTINVTTGVTTAVGALGHVVNALTFSTSGVLYAAGGDTLYTVNTTTGATTTIGNGNGGRGGTAYTSSGDLEFYKGVLYLTSQGGTGGDDRLFTINPSTGLATPVGASLGFADVFGLAQQNGILYAFTDTGSAGQSVLTINTTTGVGTKIATYTLGATPTNFGFDGTTDDADLPEPASFALVGLGLAAVVARFRSRE